jgi:L-asparaginase
VSEYDAFESPNFPLLGILGVDATFAPGLRQKGPFRLREKLESRVFLLKVFPGLDPALPLALLPHVRGLVLEAYGAGNFPIDASLGRSLFPLFQQAREREVPVVVVSQAYRNGVDLTLYESGAAARGEGAISGGDMTPSAALVKLMQGLAYYRDGEALARFIETPTVGEMTERRPVAQPAAAKKSKRA